MGIFTSRSKSVPEPPPRSAAEELGVRPPKPSKSHMAGLEAAAQLAQDKSNARLREYEAEREARRQAERARDDLLWQKVLDRQRNAVGG
jgi:hypothetical protein